MMAFGEFPTGIRVTNPQVLEGFFPFKIASVVLIFDPRGIGANRTTATSPDPELATSRKFSVGVRAMASGLRPTCTEPNRRPSLTLKIETASDPKLATYSSALSEVTKPRTGLSPIRKVPPTSFAVVSITETEEESKLLTTSSPPSGVSARWMGVFPISSNESNFACFRSTAATCPEPGQATNALEESGTMAMSWGCWQTVTVARTCNAWASRIKTVLQLQLETTTVFPPVETGARPGEAPTLTLLITVRLSRSMIDTFADPEFAT